VGIFVSFTLSPPPSSLFVVYEKKSKRCALFLKKDFLFASFSHAYFIKVSYYNIGLHSCKSRNEIGYGSVQFLKTKRRLIKTSYESRTELSTFVNTPLMYSLLFFKKTRGHVRDYFKKTSYESRTELRTFAANNPIMYSLRVSSSTTTC